MGVQRPSFQRPQTAAGRHLAAEVHRADRVPVARAHVLGSLTLARKLHPSRLEGHAGRRLQEGDGGDALDARQFAERVEPGHGPLLADLVLIERKLDGGLASARVLGELDHVDVLAQASLVHEDALDGGVDAGQRALGHHQRLIRRQRVAILLAKRRAVVQRRLIDGAGRDRVGHVGRCHLCAQEAERCQYWHHADAPRPLGCSHVMERA